MKKAIIILLAALAAASLCKAVNVPQDSIADYYFSRPLSTNFLGVVIGEPPAYRSLRREDIAWIREAACERSALARGSWWNTNSPGRMLKPVFGRFPLSDTNRFSFYTIASEWVGDSLQRNIVLGWNYVTNAFSNGAGADLAKPGSRGIDAFANLSFGSGQYRYLASRDFSPDEQHLANEPSLPSHTNIVTTVVTNWGGISWEDGRLVIHVTNYIEVITMPLTNGTVSVHTNSWQESLPWEEVITTTNIVPGSWLDFMFISREAKWDDKQAPAAMKPFPLYSYITNSYGFLKDKKYLVDQTANTNIFQSIVYRWEYDLEDEQWKMRPDVGTNYTSFVGVDLRGVVISATAEGYESGNGRLVFPTRFDWDVVHTGNVNRIKEAQVWARTTVSLDWYDSSKGQWTNTYGCCIAKVGVAEEVQQGDKLCFQANINGISVAKDGAMAIGAPVYSSWTSYGGSEGYYSVDFFLVYELQPWAGLPGW